MFFQIVIAVLYVPLGLQSLLLTCLLTLKAKSYIKSLPVVKKKDLRQVFTGANPLAVELLGLMLEIDSEIRITAEKALAHPYLAQYADPTDEPTSAPYDQSIEDMDFPVEKWRGKTTYLENVRLKMCPDFRLSTGAGGLF